MNEKKLLVGLIGSGIQKSLSPRLHEEEARHHGIRLFYQLIDLDAGGGTVDDLPTLLRAARIMPAGYPIGGVTAYGNLMSDYWYGNGARAAGLRRRAAGSR